MVMAPFWGCRRYGKSRPAGGAAGRGGLDAPLRSAHSFEDQFAMLLEYAEAFFERLEQ
jgi:hypothetical protein